MGEVIAIVENDIERDRKTCIALDKKADDGQRELAAWINNHSYTSRVVANWLGCGETRIHYLRTWAKKGFEGKPFHPGNFRAREDHPLKSKEDFQDDVFPSGEDVEDPAKTLSNVLDSIKQSKAVAGVYRKILRASPFDRAAKKEISDAIELLIRKWRSVQSTLVRKGKADGEQVD